MTPVQYGLAVPLSQLQRPHDQRQRRQDSTRGWRLEKRHRTASIDALVALALALERAEAKPQPVELLGWL
jgi:hypothetical protein